jgi:hypothetical protein
MLSDVSESVITENIDTQSAEVVIGFGQVLE